MTVRRIRDLPQVPQLFNPFNALQWARDLTARLHEEFTKPITFPTIGVIPDAGSGFTIDVRGGSIHGYDITLTTNCVLSITGLPRAPQWFEFDIILRQGGAGSHTVTWFPGIDWPAATPPTLSTVAGRVDAFDFYTSDGSNFFGRTFGINMG
jgi:hypothetical protein